MGHVVETPGKFADELVLFGVITDLPYLRRSSRIDANPMRKASALVGEPPSYAAGHKLAEGLKNRHGLCSPFVIDRCRRNKNTHFGQAQITKEVTGHKVRQR